MKITNFRNLHQKLYKAKLKVKIDTQTNPCSGTNPAHLSGLLML